MSDQLTRYFGVFFLWAFMDDHKAIECAAIAYNKFIKKNKNVELNYSLMAKMIHIVWEKKHPGFIRSKARISEDAGWVFPAGVDLRIWSQFLKQSSPDEIEVLVFSKILNLETAYIAHALDLSEGTVRYRIGKALRKLGEVMSRPIPDQRPSNGF